MGHKYFRLNNENYYSSFSPQRYADGDSEEMPTINNNNINNSIIQWNQASIKAMEGSHVVSEEVEEAEDKELLLEWSQELDFDSYVAEWSVLATTGKSDGKGGFLKSKRSDNVIV